MRHTGITSTTTRLPALQPDQARGCSNPLISVLVPVYNVAPWLDECIASIVNQTERDLEIILIDDASTDGSGEIADAWAARDERITVIHKPVNLGLYDSRNMSVRLARGDYIAFVDSDDYIKPDMFSKMLALLRREDADVAVCGWTKVTEGGAIDRPLYVETGTTGDAEFTLAYCIPDEADPRYNGDLWTKLFKRNAILGDDGFPIAFDTRRRCCEDLVWDIKVLMRIKKAVFLNECLYVYRAQRPQNTSSRASMDSKLAWDSVQAFTEGRDLLASAGFSAATNVAQKSFYHRQRCMGAAVICGDDEAYQSCSDHYLRDVWRWFAENPSVPHFVWFAKRLIRRCQLACRHQLARGNHGQRS